ncbi:unnamed protein product [Albugo candida]|uniref:Uncharacterized protein n=1 Tax=Albugo candida TaxID=65357 RepID=A0A024GK13_9STRA|nr:unnamed protein product [Albugo candida]|eukprot:CCI46674.1 unnamed protein product [Albugo candida]
MTGKPGTVVNLHREQVDQMIYTPCGYASFDDRGITIGGPTCLIIIKIFSSSSSNFVASAAAVQVALFSWYNLSNSRISANASRPGVCSGVVFIDDEAAGRSFGICIFSKIGIILHFSDGYRYIQNTDLRFLLFQSSQFVSFAVKCLCISIRLSSKTVPVPGCFSSLTSLKLTCTLHIKRTCDGFYFVYDCLKRFLNEHICSVLTDVLSSSSAHSA